ncbi:M23 family metallopeptidase [Lysobacter pythonis]|uniref:M23 family metallopeptidase n=1 Tax=Solilutibacter pythonis TaxID=2483112 RepID=A0A3M2HMP6_9GAMM|nr:M23 family metallopeptidase [Lysobacter pythonis]RMH88619.1 M23 family metallopeptidase [Lysobacter pythonis]
MHRCNAPAAARHPRLARPIRLALNCLPWLLVTLPLAAPAQWIGWPPEAPPATPAADSPPAPEVSLRILALTDAREVWVDNALSGPVEVHVNAKQPVPGLPIQRLLPRRGAYRIARLPGGGALRLELLAVPGAPGARAHDIAYRFPLRLPQPRIGQPPQGAFSHADAENREAIDFVAPVGTPVIAARAGTVMRAEGRFGDTPGRFDQANFLRILHGDGSMAVYAHLQHGSLQVTPGQWVETGQVIARSGNSGYSSGPHLHFAVQVNTGLRLESVPVRILGHEGELRLPHMDTQHMPGNSTAGK